MKDRARELVSLKSSYYAFPEENWHANEVSWIGHNLNTKHIVILKCVRDLTDDGIVQSTIDYANRIVPNYDYTNSEIIVAIEDSVENFANLRSHQIRAPRVRFETEATLLDGLVDWTDYRNDIIRRYELDHLLDSDLTVADVYVSPDVETDFNGRVRACKLEEHLDAWLSDPTQRQIALLGDYGQGKSTSALAYAYRELMRERPARVPVLIELRGLAPGSLAPLQLLGAWSARYNINPRSLIRLHIAGRLLLMFEGFDEMALVGDEEIRIDHFRTLWAFCYPQSKVLITGRPNFFFDEEEKTRALGIHQPNTGRPYCQPFRLKEFDLKHIRQALRAHDRTQSDEICDLAGRNLRFRELIGRPSLLHAVALVWRDENLSEETMGLNSARVMRMFIHHSYRRQGLKEADTSAFMALTTEERHYFMRGVATYMAARDLPNQIRGSELNCVIESLVQTMPEDVSLR